MSRAGRSRRRGRLPVVRLLLAVAVALVVGVAVAAHLNDRGSGGFGAGAAGGGGSAASAPNGANPVAAPPSAGGAAASSNSPDASPSGHIEPPVTTGARLPEAPLSEAGPGDVKDLQPALRHAILAAIYAAKQDGVRLDVNSGYRTPTHQEELYQQGIAKYGSAQAAHAWVLPPNESDHVKGEAVDVEPAAGIAWLERNGERFGLCRKYANENWHFELLAPEIGSTCPPMLPHA